MHNNTFYTGIVESRLDPDKLGRLKVRVHGIHTADKSFLSTEELPWAMPIQAITSAATSGIGESPTGLVEGSVVLIIFIDPNDFQKPLILGSVAGLPRFESNPNIGFNDPNGKYPIKEKLNQSDIPDRARNEGVVSAANESNVPAGFQGIWSEPADPYNAAYPNNHSYFSESGHIQEYDDTPSHERVLTQHRTGTKTEYRPDGGLVKRVVADNYEIIAGDDLIYIKGNAAITCEGNIQIYTQSSAEIVVDGDAKVRVGGNCSTLTEGTCSHVAKGNMYIHSDSELILSGAQIHANTAGKISPNVLVPDLEVTLADSTLQGDEPEAPTEITQEELNTIQERSDVPQGEIRETDTTPAPETPLVTTECGFTEDWTYSDSLSTRYTIGSLSRNAVFPHDIRAQHGLTELQIICNLKGLAENVIEPLADEFGTSRLQINSGFRQGTGRSQHERGQAVDIQFRGWTVEQYVEAAKWIRDNLPFDQSIIEYGGRNPWLHISYRDDRQRKSILTRTNANNYVPGILTIT